VPIKFTDPFPGEEASSIVKSALSDEKPVALHCIDQPMFPVDSARPEAGPVSAQRLGFANAFEGVALNVSDQFIDAFELLRVRQRSVRVSLIYRVAP
jgi:hypothetical protein